MTRAPSGRRQRGAAASVSAPAYDPSGRAAVAVAVAAAVTFAPAIGNGFVNLDDSHNLLENPMFRGVVIAALRTSIALDPREMRAHATLATQLAARGEVEDAIAEYREALRLAPSAAVYNNLAALLADHGRATDAVALYRSAVALAPRAAAVHENLGHALVATGDAAGAAAAVREALRLDPRLEGARRGLAALATREAGR